MVRFSGCFLAGALLFLAGHGATGADLQGRSTSKVEKRADGFQTVSVENTTFVPYAVFNGKDSSYALRMATLVTRFKFATGQEPAPFDATVAVSIDDVSGAAAKRLVSFTDPGAEGRLLTDKYFITTQPGCCAELVTHHVRFLETGKLLFRSTGREASRGIAWMEAPNTPIRRWAAVDGKTTEAEWKRGLVGRVRYGDNTGVLSTIEIAAEPDSEIHQDYAMAFGQATEPQWFDRNRKTGADPDYRASAGEAGSPHVIWSLDGAKAPVKAVGGFELRLRLVYEPADTPAFLVIPIEADAQQAEKATGIKGLKVTRVPN